MKFHLKRILFVCKYKTKGFKGRAKETITIPLFGFKSYCVPLLFLNSNILMFRKFYINMCAIILKLTDNIAI